MSCSGRSASANCKQAKSSSISSRSRSRSQSDRNTTIKTESAKKKPSHYPHQQSQQAVFESKCSREFNKLQSNCRLVLDQDIVR